MVNRKVNCKVSAKHTIYIQSHFPVSSVLWKSSVSVFQSSSNMSNHVYNNCHINCVAESPLASGSLRLKQFIAAALRLPEASQDRTYGSAFHRCRGGPTSETNSVDKCCTVIVLCSSSQIRFMRLKLLSQSAVLIGSVSTYLLTPPQMHPWSLCSPGKLSSVLL